MVFSSINITNKFTYVVYFQLKPVLCVCNAQLKLLIPGQLPQKKLASDETCRNIKTKAQEILKTTQIYHIKMYLERSVALFA